MNHSPLLTRRSFVIGGSALAAYAAFNKGAKAVDTFGAITGKRDPWSPYMIPRSVLKAWWNADDHGTSRMTDDGSGLISSCKDRIGELELTAATTARPTWSATGLENKAALTFDGVANCLVTTTLTSIPTGTTPGGMLFVGRSTASLSDAAARFVCQYGSTGGARRAVRIFGDGSRRICSLSAEGSLIDDTAHTLANSGHVFGGQFGATSMEGYVDGDNTSPAAASYAAINTGTTRFRIGAGNAGTAANFYTGSLRHAFIWSGVLDTFQLNQLMAWCLWDIGLQSLLPSTHIFSDKRP